MDMASLPRAVELARAGARNPRWHPGAGLALHSEIFVSADDGAGAGLVLALARNALRQKHAQKQARKRDSHKYDSQEQVAGLEEGAVLWVQDKQAIRLCGRPYRPGLPEDLRGRVIHVAAKTAADALFALEEGVRCRDLACVIGEIAANPRAMDFTASRRLSLTAQKHDVPLFLLRIGAQTDLSSARMRWRVRSAPSAPPLWDRGAPGRPAWHAELFRARSHAPGEWILRDDQHALAAERCPPATPDHGDLVREAGA